LQRKINKKIKIYKKIK